MNEGSRCINDQLPGFDIARDETGDDDRPERAQGSEDDPERQVADDVRGNVEGDRRGTPGQTFWVGLHQRISPKWHAYWMNPGDSGEPPRIEWALPSGFTAGEIAWPFPERIPAGPAMTYGYSVGCSIFGRFTTEGSGSMPGPTEAQPAHGARTRCRGARAPHRRTHARRPIAGKRTRRPRGCRGGSCGADYPIRPAGTQARGGPLTPRSGYDYG